MIDPLSASLLLRDTRGTLATSALPDAPVVREAPRHRRPRTADAPARMRLVRRRALRPAPATPCTEC